ncbi:MAG: hypothetical protein Q9162_004175 [Coniocarpon cinnabarinum]
MSGESKQPSASQHHANGDLICPVTAVKITADLLFAACGTNLLVFNLPTLQFLSSFQIFKWQAIHGIASREIEINKLIVLVWGGYVARFVRVCVHDEDVGVTKGTICVSQRRFPTVKFDDRILDASLRIDDESDAPSHLRALLATAHKAMWSLTMSLPNDDGSSISSQISSTCTARIDTAHDGAVFGLDFHVDQANSSDDSIVLTTCGDDRTIRVWEVQCRGSPEHRHGFMNKEKELLAIDSKGWIRAHSSRVWRIRAVERQGNLQPTSHSMALVSAGEDASCHVWQCASSKHTKHTTTDIGRDASIRHVYRAVEHSGKNIWASDSQCVTPGLVHVTTGGADGAIASNALPTAELQSPLTDFRKQYQVLKLPPGAGANDLRKVRNFTWTASGSLLVLLEDGHAWTSNEEGQRSWTYIGHQQVLGRHSVLQAVVQEDIVLVGTADGIVYTWTRKTRELIELFSIPGKILSLLVNEVVDQTSAEHLSGVTDKHFVCLVRCLNGSTEAAEITVNEAGYITRSCPIQGLKLESEISPTSIMCTRTDSHSLQLLVGDREGNIHRHCFSTLGKNDSAPPLKGPAPFQKVHEDAITTILLLRSDALHNDHRYILTTSRDGTYKVLSPSLYDHQKSMTVVQEQQLPFGPLIEGAFISKGDRHLILYGFQGNDFAVFDSHIDRIIASVNCKGGHRLWSFSPNAGSNSDKFVGSFAWNTHGELNVCRLERSTQKTVLAGGHGREIKSCAIQPPSVSTTSQRLFATGAEDTTIRLFFYNTTSGSHNPFRCIRVIRKHNTGIQDLLWSRCGQYLLSCGGSEELYIWRVSTLPVIEIGVRMVASMPRLSEVSPDFRVTSFDLVEDEAARLLAVCLSDSSVRLYRWDNAESALWLLWMGAYTSCCLTQICMWKSTLNDSSETEAADCLSIVATATDGSLAHWTCNPLDPLVLRNAKSARVSTDQEGSVEGGTVQPSDWTKRTHQNAIKCLLNIELLLASRARLFVTAGDDNSIAFTILAPDKMRVLRIPRAHAASVTTLALIDGPIMIQNGGDRGSAHVRVASSGNDMHVKVWDVFIPLTDGDYGDEYVEVKKAGKVRTQIADVGDMAVIGEVDGWRRVLIVGVGMEVILVKGLTQDTL